MFINIRHTKIRLLYLSNFILLLIIISFKYTYLKLLAPLVEFQNRL